MANNNGVIGIPSGFHSLDKKIKGWQKGLLHVLAARPRVGKTTFAIQTAYNLAVNDHPVLFFSLEMQKHELGVKLLALRTGKNPSYFEHCDKDKLRTLGTHCNDIGELPLLIDGDPYQTVETIHARIERILAEQQLGLVIVDHAQIVGVEQKDRKNLTRDRELGHISGGLKKIAKKCRVPILLLCQLNRQIEFRGKDAEPILADLRESGNIEQDADQVIMIHRPEIGQERQAEDATFHVNKNRMGQQGKVKLTFDRSLACFKEDTP